MHLSRRAFNALAATVAAAAVCQRKSFGLAANCLRIGLNTFSLRTLSPDEAIPVIIQAMKQEGLQDCELLFNHVEPARHGAPTFSGGTNGIRSAPTPEQLEQQKAAAAALAEWRLSVPMGHFENIKATFDKEGLKIKCCAVRLGSTDAEIDRQFLMAKTLGAESINSRLRQPQLAWQPQLPKSMA